MTSQKLFDTAMIFSIGISPIVFEYVKQNIQATTVFTKIQEDIDAFIQKKQQKQRRKINHIQLKQLIQSKQPQKINSNIDLRIKIAKKWKQTNYQENLPVSFGIAAFNALGSLILPTPFFLSALSYFLLYQFNFANDYLTLSGKPPLFQTNKFSFQKINQLYFYGTILALGLAGSGRLLIKMVNKGIKNDKFV